MTNLDPRLFVDPPREAGERRTTLHDPVRGERIIHCQECGREIEGYALRSVYGMTAGYLWRHVDDLSTYCVPEPRRARPYDEWDAERQIERARP